MATTLKLLLKNYCCCKLGQIATNTNARLFSMRVPDFTGWRWKGHAWRRWKYRVSVYKLNVQILSQMLFTKKGSYNWSLQGKTTMSDGFELGEDETDPTSSVTF